MSMNVDNLNLMPVKTTPVNVWTLGDYAKFAVYLVDGAVSFLESCNIPTSAKVLDVGCGAGQTAIPMSRMGINVTGLDIAGNLVEVARQRAQAEGLSAHFDEGDAQQMPYADATFDVVFSLIGAMFAANPQKVAAEFARVSRPGGRIIMANWTPSGFVGQMFKIIATHVPPPQGVPSPVLWGDEATVQERLGAYVSDLKLTRHLYAFKYPFGPSEVVEFFRAYYGPANRAFSVLDDSGQAALRRDLESLWSKHNQASDGTTHIEAEFLNVQAIRA